MALPRPNRLKSRKDFQAVFREGIRRHGTYLTLRALRPSSPKSCFENVAQKKVQLPIKVGVSISTKVSKRAVVRNRMKRQITAHLQELLPKLSPGWQIVVVVKPTATEYKCVTEQFLQELEQLLAQAEVLNGDS